MKSNRCNRETICLLANGVLPKREQVEAEIHLATCVGCRTYYNEIQMLSAPLAQWEKKFIGIKPDKTLQARWANEIKATGKTNSFRPLSSAIRILWHELIWPCRHAWTGMAALWLVLLGINSNLAKDQPAIQSVRSTPAILQAMEEQRQLLAELALPIASQPAEPPRRNQPQPRSEIQTTWIIG